jgi:predicted RNA-binding Zn-ribbon protein involved in translation (DUF1610 family)
MAERDLVEVRLLRLPRKCLLCQGELDYNDELLICPNCGALYHARCVAELVQDMNCVQCGRLSMKRGLLKW